METNTARVEQAETSSAFPLTKTALSRKRAAIKLDRDQNYCDGIVACDRDGVLTLFNRATKDEIPLFCALKGESLRNVEMMIIPQHGESLALLANGDPIIDNLSSG